MALRLLHVSDLHFGRSSVAAQVEGVERLFESEQFDAIVISGDLSQCSRRRELERARKFVDDAARHAPVLVIPGNHDTAWWTAPLGLGSVRAMTARYRQYVNEELEPVLHIPGATIVGLNSSHGIRAYTLTARPRDLSVVGAVVTAQWDKAKHAFAQAPKKDVKVLVIHHNLLRGEISNRWGLANRASGIENAVATGAQIVLCGHDHQAAVDCVDLNGKRTVVVCASTLTTRVRGGGPGAINVLEIDDQTVQVSVMQWSDQEKAFTRAIWSKYSR